MERENSSVESILSLRELCRFTTDFRCEKEEKGRKVEQEVERENQDEETTRMTMHMDHDMKDSNLSQSACVCADEDKTTLPERMRTLRSVEVVAGVRIVRCHAIIDVVIDVRVVECHASMDVVIGVHVVVCHQAINFPLF